MLAVRYNDPTGEMELCGDPAALDALGERIKTGPFGMIHLDVSGNLGSYSRFFRLIEIRDQPGMVSLQIAPDRETLVIAGNERMRGVLGENVCALARDAEEGSHLHIEYFEGHFYLSEKSEPLVISVV